MTPQPNPRSGHSPDLVILDEAFQFDDSFLEAWLDYGRQITTTLAHIGEEIGKAAEAMQQLGLLAEQPPADPQARALWLRQHRNTGPARKPQRAPRELGLTSRRRTR